MHDELDNLPFVDEYKELPKVELHLHLSGSVSIDVLSKLSGLSKEEVIEKVVAKDKISSFDFIDKVDFSNNLLQTKENIYIACKDLVDRLSEDNVIYAEVRLTPMAHLENGLSYEEVIDSAISGLNSNPKIKVNLILCMQRGATLYQNEETLKYARMYLGKGVCALDIVGDEELYPLHNYMNLFELAALEHIPYTIHTGRNIDDLYDALILHTKRISNGVKETIDIDLLRFLYYKKIMLELSPSSDVIRKNIDSLDGHPIEYYINNGFNICINTDNRTLTNISLSDEYRRLADTFKFTIDDFKKMNLNAINSSFLSNEEKEKYCKYFE